MSLSNPDTIVTEQGLSDFYKGIYPYLIGGGSPKPPIVYGMRILADESVPSDKVVYLEDAVGMTPAHMDFTNDVFDYGSWEHAFFMPKPCMLKYDGTVDYYLDPNDYTKKEDGTASDVANTSYEGNAMMEWPKIWLKIVPDTTKDNKEADIFISDTQMDDDYHDWPYHNSLGESVEHFYTAIYDGSKISNTLRSISGQAPYNNENSYNERTYANNNNKSESVIWTMETIAGIDLITFLIVLISKTTDSQTAFGKGVYYNSQGVVDGFRTGVHNTKGLFYGTNSVSVSTSNYNNMVKVFGMENWWGFIARRYLGEVSINGVRKRKLTYNTEDGSTVVGYNVTGNGYINSNVSACTGTSGLYMKDIIYTEQGIFPYNMASDASSSTYYCDGTWYNNSITAIPFHGNGASSTANQIYMGAFQKTYTQQEGIQFWYFGASIFACPLS